MSDSCPLPHHKQLKLICSLIDVKQTQQMSQDAEMRLNFADLLVPT